MFGAIDEARAREAKEKALAVMPLVILLFSGVLDMLSAIIIGAMAGNDVLHRAIIDSRGIENISPYAFTKEHHWHDEGLTDAQIHDKLTASSQHHLSQLSQTGYAFLVIVALAVITFAKMLYDDMAAEAPRPYKPHGY